ncbi:succinylglutamate desuccinylase/aspartoacylase family protein [Streptomyces sp. VNUA24]|uniref:succinylglutamate desuccinylase/aspartoacylase family protein n=1 Tax=Streptomyces sp. VNUA24 TaxID=3031131 RepID=UPI0023B7DEF9|nr:succinylglutamate desuccinylase/aspartoacylase family protein [Streptomyces sp. VNUA24]WEH19829.1 succinylglutamate desuccinylase/aspartoacylase family protein [Streptomyces sp. VNUA24]
MNLTIGTLRAEPGRKTRGSLPADLGTTTVEVPLTLVNGSRPGPRVVITGGVHGGEFIGVDAAARLAGLLEPDEVAGQVVICPVANPPAVYGGRLNISPLDGVNINRVFPGDKDSGPTERIAAWLFDHLIDGADAYVDLHSGGIDQHLLDFVGYRLTADAELGARIKTMAHAVGYERVIFGTSPDGGNSHAAANRQGVPAILVETGRLGDRDPAAVRRLLDGLYRLLHHLGVSEAPQHLAPVTVRTRDWMWTGEVESPAPGLWYPDAVTGDEVTEGQTIGRIIDPADGTELKVTAVSTGTIIYHMNGLTVRPGTHLAAIAAPHG